MHELALSQSIVELVLAQAQREGMHSVTRVVVEVGAFSGVEPAALQFCFDAVTRRTPAEGAALRIDTLPVRGRCRTCGHEFSPDGVFTPCPRCGADGIRLTGGQELRVREFEGA